MYPYFNEALAQQRMAQLQQEADEARLARRARARRRRTSGRPRSTLRLGVGAR
jgi:hypothetical protein